MSLVITGFAEPVMVMAVLAVGAASPTQLVPRLQTPLSEPSQVWANACGVDIAKRINANEAGREDGIREEGLAFIVIFEGLWDLR
jgi:hypothetical protein